MAEGADQMAVKARPAAWAVDAVLPFPRARYREDFAPDRASGGVDRRTEFDAALAAASSVVELPEDGAAPEAYQAAGEFVLRQSDLLVVVWDGEPAAGRGGTAARIPASR